MGVSRKPADASFPWRACLDAGLLQSVRDCLAGVPASLPVAVALSAGPDSSMLALHAACAAAEQRRALHCLHVHHGLQREADAWLLQAHRLAGLLQVSCHSSRVRVERNGRGMEAAARAARYDALQSMAVLAGVRHVLLAHHQDDQAETVLLRLLRGAGPLGLAAMAAEVGVGSLVCHRPWLGSPRSIILACASRFAQASGWRPVEDPSNRDNHYARAALRTEVVPLLDAHWPAWRQTLGRHARQAGELAGWVADAAAADWQQLEPAADGQSFSLAAWRALPPAHQAPLVRYWLQRLGLRMPTEARLQAWLRQLRGVHALGHDRAVRLPHEGRCIVVQRGRVGITAKTQVE